MTKKHHDPKEEAEKASHALDEMRKYEDKEVLKSVRDALDEGATIK